MPAEQGQPLLLAEYGGADRYDPTADTPPPALTAAGLRRRPLEERAAA
jgi:hypothetical protein